MGNGQSQSTEQKTEQNDDLWWKNNCANSEPTNKATNNTEYATEAICEAQVEESTSNTCLDKNNAKMENLKLDNERSQKQLEEARQHESIPGNLDKECIKDNKDIPGRESPDDDMFVHLEQDIITSKDTGTTNSETVEEDEKITKPNRVLNSATVKELNAKREAREHILKTKKKEIQELRAELERQKEQNVHLKLRLEAQDNGNESNLMEENSKLKEELSNVKSELQTMTESIENEREQYQYHVNALKEVIKVSKVVTEVRDTEIQRLKEKLDIMERRANDEEAQVMSEEVRAEYERQFQNIKNLRNLYEERARIARIERSNLTDLVQDTQEKLQFQNHRNQELEERVKELEEDVSNKYDEIAQLRSNLGLSAAELRGLQNEMNVINQLFSQILVGTEIDLDKLSQVLEQNHDLLTDIQSTEMPKVLLNLLTQMQAEDGSQTTQTGNSTNGCSNTAEEILNNLPKVWRVLSELLSQQIVEPVQISETAPVDSEHPCYKSVDTPLGPKNVLSLSKTYIRLKDLILEKKHLEKEMVRMKDLNSHLENRLQDQEKRLQSVTKELGKTWHLVDKMDKQHEQLHTQEQILRYELSLKRKLLTQLKGELESCRENWLKAREKNSESEEECQKLRNEFALRRLAASNESGYSDDSSTDNENQECQRKVKKSNLLHQIHLKNAAKEVKEEVMTDKKEVNTDEIASCSSENPENTVDQIGERCDEFITKTQEILQNSQLKKLESDFKKLVTDLTNEENDSKSSATDEEREEGDRNDENDTNKNKKERSAEEILAERDARFKRLEEQCASLKKKYTSQTERGQKLCSKLDSLHEQYSKSSEDQVEVEVNTSTASENSNENFTKTNDRLKLTNDASIEQAAMKENQPENPSSIPEEAKLIQDVPLNERLLNDETSCNEALTEREVKFKRLEEQCATLKKIYASQTEKGKALCSKFDSLHEQYKKPLDESGNDDTSSREISDESCRSDSKKILANSQENNMPLEEITSIISINQENAPTAAIIMSDRSDSTEAKTTNEFVEECSSIDPTILTMEGATVAELEDRIETELELEILIEKDTNLPETTSVEVGPSQSIMNESTSTDIATINPECTEFKEKLTDNENDSNQSKTEDTQDDSKPLNENETEAEPSSNVTEENSATSEEISAEDEERMRKIKMIEARFRAIQEEYAQQCEAGNRIAEKINKLQQNLEDKQ